MEQARKRRSEKVQTKDDQSSQTKEKDQKIEADKQAADELMDAIDALLEENAESFVKNYVQQGGQ